jgi:hypothetical protein
MKLNEKELETIREMQGEFQKAKLALADLELNKHQLLKTIDVLKQDFGKQEQKLIDKYGADSVINVQTGEVTENKK